MTIPEDLSKVLIELRLRHFEKAVARELSALAPGERDRLISMLRRWAQAELAERKTTAIQSKIRNAKFIKNQTIEQKVKSLGCSSFRTSKILIKSVG